MVGFSIAKLESTKVLEPFFGYLKKETPEWRLLKKTYLANIFSCIQTFSRVDSSRRSIREYRNELVLDLRRLNRLRTNHSHLSASKELIQYEVIICDGWLKRWDKLSPREYFLDLLALDLDMLLTKLSQLERWKIIAYILELCTRSGGKVSLEDRDIEDLAENVRKRLQRIRKKLKGLLFGKDCHKYQKERRAYLDRNCSKPLLPDFSSFKVQDMYRKDFLRIELRNIVQNSLMDLKGLNILAASDDLSSAGIKDVSKAVDLVAADHDFLIAFRFTAS